MGTASPGDAPVQPWRLLAAFLVLTALIAGVGAWAYMAEVAYLEDKENQELRAIANFKATLIADWLAERRLDAQSVAGTFYFREDLERWLEGRDFQSGERLRARLESLRLNDDYVGLELLDAQGLPRLIAGSPVHGEPQVAAAVLARISQAREPQLVDLHRDGDHIDLCYLMPIRRHASADPFGYLRLCINPRHRLFPLVQGWPTPSDTAETLIVRREGDEVLYLSELRHRADTALNFRLPLERGDLPAAAAARGYTGSFSGVDYRGVPVLSYLRQIPGTPWAMVTKIDQGEVFQNIGRVARGSLFGVAAAIVVSGLFLWLFWFRQQLAASRATARALAQRNEELEALMATVPALVFVADDPDCRTVAGNRAVQEMFGVGTGTNLSRFGAESGQSPLWRVFGPEGEEYRPREMPMPQAARTGLPVHGHECQIHFPDGRRVWLLGSAVPLFDEKGLVRGAVACYADISALKATEESQRRNKAILVQAEQMARLGAWSVELDGWGRASRVAWSAETFRLLGYAQGAVEPTLGHFLARIHPGDRRRVSARWQEALARGGLFASEFRVVHPDGQELVIHGRAEFQVDEGDPTIRCYGALQDITDRKRSEEALAAHQEELERQVAARTAELLAVNKELQAFTYAASHDLKAPLRKIGNFSSLLERSYGDRLEGNGRLFLDFIQGAVARMDQLIEDLLAHARLDQQVLDLQPVALAEVVQAVVAERREEIRERGAEVRVQLPAVAVWAETHGLTQALRNLLENALKYSARAASPAIAIGAAPSGNGLRLWVRDNGIGFDMAYHDRIFEIFRRLHTYEEYPGSGVGLALVKKAMERMGGRVWAESAPGEGACFYIELTLAAAPTTDAGEPLAACLAE